jgi:hypothetical protein
VALNLPFVSVMVSAMADVAQTNARRIKLKPARSFDISSLMRAEREQMCNLGTMIQVC